MIVAAAAATIVSASAIKADVHSEQTLQTTMRGQIDRTPLIGRNINL